MGRKRNNEVRMTLYRLVDLPTYDAAICGKYRDFENEDHQYTCESVSIADRQALLFWGVIEHDRASWTKTVSELTNQNLNVGNTTASAVIIVPDDSDVDIDDGALIKSEMQKGLHSAWAITFGMGFQILDQNYIDIGFGQRVAIRCASSDGLNTLNKTTLAERPQMIRSTIPSGGTLRSLGFEELGDFVTRLVAKGTIEGIGSIGKSITVRGADSLNIPLSKSPQKLLENLSQIKNILNRKPISTELAALENLTLIKKKEINEELDQKLISAIDEKTNCSVELSYPYEMIDEFGQANSYKLYGVGRREIKDSMPTLDDLLNPVRDADKSLRLGLLRKMSVVLYSDQAGTDVLSQHIPLKKWLTYQTNINGKRYFLQNNRWYVMDREYVETISQEVNAIFARGPFFDELPKWPIYQIPDDKDKQRHDNAELQYNTALAEYLGGLCLDQQLIRPKGSKSGIEACDVLLKSGIFVHVKHISSSAPASHLLAQTLVSADLLSTDEEARRQLQEKINEAGGGNDSEYETKPKRVVVVMAQDDKPLSAESLFTFTKINLVRHDHRFASMGIKLNIASVIRKKH
ncbi:MULTISPECIES: DUF6119 family protein [Bifidobacterium]|uniref:Sporadically distributed protein, TIGR04141 family n=1 Tax=Bifidobacterium tibiigranuli TaxID=2172043 RepID=A0A5N6RYD9_9BIFI|nr:DUF6119 family protein [Bifidobacterium tibiigranuli]KAE8126243.1 hypothetical protein DDF78_11595 [Bifidobacterium tibiigranuli]KAE8127718.1 hypothetical protein DDE84_07265 [Bifidobacterium tibiigranuli]